MLTVILASALTARLGGGGSIGSSAQVSPAIRAHVAPLMADAFGYTFWWALGLLIVAFAFSTMLPKRKPANATAGAPIPMA